MTEKEEVSAPARIGSKKPFYKHITLSLSAFVMSLAATMISVYYGLRGSEIVVAAPQQLLLYRDGKGEQAVLNFAVRMPMINAAADYGDVLVEARLRPEPRGPDLAYVGSIQPIFTSNSADIAKSCNSETRCTVFLGLSIAENADEIVDLPAGGARLRYFAFTAAEWNCSGRPQDCARYGSFDKAVKSLAGLPLDVEIQVSFYNDGRRKIRCVTGPVDGRYLSTLGWINLQCKQAKVSGGASF